MSILSDLGTKIGAKIKELTTLVNTKLDKTAKAADSDKFDSMDSASFIFGDDPSATSQVTDFDAITKSGFYDGSSTAIGNPFPDWAWVIHHEHSNQNGYGFQMAIDNGNSDSMQIRIQSGNNWSSWTPYNTDTSKFMQVSTTAITNIDDKTLASGSYRVDTATTGGTKPTTYGSLIVGAYDTNYPNQMFIAGENGSRVFTRRNDGTTWQPWTQVGGASSGSGTLLQMVYKKLTNQKHVTTSSTYHDLTAGNLSVTRKNTVANNSILKITYMIPSYINPGLHGWGLKLFRSFDNATWVEVAEPAGSWGLDYTNTSHVGSMSTLIMIDEQTTTNPTVYYKAQVRVYNVGDALTLNGYTGHNKEGLITIEEIING